MRIRVASIAFIVAVLAALPAWAHVSLESSSPHEGDSVTTSPRTVKLRFNGQIEPVFSTLLVKNAAGEPVSQGKGEVDAKDHTLLQATLPQPLAPGSYAVYWSVVAHDGHRSAGHFSFSVK